MDILAAIERIKYIRKNNITVITLPSGQKLDVINIKSKPMTYDDYMYMMTKPISFTIDN